MKARISVLCLATLLLVVACRDSQTEVPYAPPDIHSLQLRTFEELWRVVDENYVYTDFNGADWQAVHDDYQAKLVEELDSATFNSIMAEMLATIAEDDVHIQTRAERLALANEDTTMYEGIGTVISMRDEPEPRIVVLDVMAGSPAERAGLQAHDAILAIDGDRVADYEDDEAVDHVRGPAGTDVVLTVRSPGEPERTVTVTRGEVGRTLSQVQWHSPPASGVTYFLFPPTGYESLAQDFLAGLEEQSANDELMGAVLDLRPVSAGLNWPVASLLSLFVDGEVGETYSREEGAPVAINGVDSFADSQSLPLVVLVGPGTKGLPELFAAVLQRSDRATIIGMPTPGDIENTSAFLLPDGSRAMVPTTSFRTADGYEVGVLGVDPDLPVGYDWDEVSAGEDPVLDEALEWLAGQAEG